MRGLGILLWGLQVVAGNDTTSHVSKSEGIVLETYPSTSSMLDVSRDVMKWAMFVDNHIHPQLLVALGMMGMHGTCDTLLTNTTLMQRMKVREYVFCSPKITFVFLTWFIEKEVDLLLNVVRPS